MHADREGRPVAGMGMARLGAWGAIVMLPLAALLLLLLVPELDARWEHQPAHFWLVLGAAGVNAALAYTTGDAARRRGDARVFVVSVAFLCSAGFLFLHALATPGVLLDGPNTGFVSATPFGLAACGILLAVSSAPWMRRAGMRRVAHLRPALLGVLVAWAVVSIAQWPPLHADSPLQRGSPALLVLAAVGIAAFGASAVGYASVFVRRRSRLVGSLVAASLLLGQAMVAVAFSRSWHVSWWEWHVLMLVAFAVVAWSARSQWREEPFAGLYLDETLASSRDVTVIFADLQGFTAWSEGHDTREVAEMLNALFEVAVPAVVDGTDGELSQLLGDAIMVTFNARGDQPDHAQRAAHAAIALKHQVAELAARHPSWPRLRIGVNTGEAAVGVLGSEGGRTFTAVGDAVNVAARLQQAAPPGEVVIGRPTLEALTAPQVEHLGALTMKGKREPVDAYLLRDL